MFINDGLNRVFLWESSNTTSAPTAAATAGLASTGAVVGGMDYTPLKNSVQTIINEHGLTMNDYAEINYCTEDNQNKYLDFIKQLHNLTAHANGTKLKLLEKRQLTKYIDYLKEEYKEQLEEAKYEGYADLCTPDEDENTPSAPAVSTPAPARAPAVSTPAPARAPAVSTPAPAPVSAPAVSTPAPAPAPVRSSQHNTVLNEALAAAENAGEGASVHPSQTNEAHSVESTNQQVPSWRTAEIQSVANDGAVFVRHPSFNDNNLKGMRGSRRKRAKGRKQQKIDKDAAKRTRALQALNNL